jgi:hypothetical protein
MVASGSLHIFELQDYLKLCCFTMSQQKASRFHQGSASTPVDRQIQVSAHLKEEKDVHAAMVDTINTTSSHISKVGEKIKNLEDMVSFWKEHSEYYLGQASYYRNKYEKTKEKLEETRKKLRKTAEFHGWWPEIASDEDDE